MDHHKSSSNDSQISASNVIKKGTEKAGTQEEQTPAHTLNSGFVVGPDLLAEVLNKKKMELLKSQVVKDFLKHQQSKLSGKPLKSDHVEGVKKSYELCHNDKVNYQDSSYSSPSNHQR